MAGAAAGGRPCECGLGRRHDLCAEPIRSGAGPSAGSTRSRTRRSTTSKELRPASRGRSEIRILFVFDPWRSAILLVAGDEARQWNRWYERAIPHAEHLYETYLKERGE